MTPETVEISILPGYWSIIAIIVIAVIVGDGSHNGDQNNTDD